MRRVIAVDFDGTLCENRRPEIGPTNWPLVDWLLEQKAKGDALVLWTCRDGELLDRAAMWCLNRGIRFDAINDNIQERKDAYGNNSRKVSADLYIDDKNAWVVETDPEPIPLVWGVQDRRIIVYPPEKTGFPDRVKWLLGVWKKAAAVIRETRKTESPEAKEPKGTKAMPDPAPDKNNDTAKEEKNMGYPTAEWRIYNQGDQIEFAECSECGHEEEPNVTLKKWYPAECPGCGAKMVDAVPVEELEETVEPE